MVPGAALYRQLLGGQLAKKPVDAETVRRTDGVNVSERERIRVRRPLTASDRILVDELSSPCAHGPRRSPSSTALR
jgi:hypothetical protein